MTMSTVIGLVAVRRGPILRPSISALDVRDEKHRKQRRGIFPCLIATVAAGLLICRVRFGAMSRDMIFPEGIRTGVLV